MSLHEEVSAAIQREIEDLGDAIALSPTAVALAVQRRFCGEHIEPHVQYTSLEHLKHMARVMLARRFDADSDENEAYCDQGELFSGQLQQRYPVPRVRGEEPTYKRRDSCTYDELIWNADQLSKSATARQAHSDAVRAYAESKFRAALAGEAA